MEKIKLHIIPGVRRLLVAGIFFLANYASAQINISSTPGAVNDTINLCSSGSISFTSSGSGYSTASWFFQSGTPSSASGNGPHSINYSSPGTYVVRVIGYDSGLPTDTAYHYVVVGTPSPASFTPPIDTLCVSGTPAAPIGGSPAGGYYTGNGMVGGLFDPSIAGLGRHKITYHYQNGSCTDTASHIYTVINAPTANLAAQGTPIMFNGQLTYTRCLPANSTFQFICTTPSSQYTSYSIDFGNGSPVQTGTVFPSPSLNYTYAGTGFYKVALTLYGPNGCADTDTIRIFYGSNPAVGLATKGSSVKCLPNDSSGITVWFDILKTSTNPPGTIYIIETNDGSPPITLSHPPPDSISHTFFEPSCGYNSYSYANSFEIKITAQAPCQPNTTVSIEPIYISDPPTAAFDVDPRVCIGNPALVNDASWGSENALNGCDTSVLLVWEISPATYTLNSGYQGSFNGSSNPMNWFGGTPQLNVTFNKTGYYTIKQYVGNQAGCEIDTAVQVICVDSIPDPTFGMDKDTICAPDTVTAFYMNNLITFCDTTQLEWEISPSTGFNMLTNSTDSVFKAYFFSSDIYTISISSNNHCDTSSFVRTLVVQNEPTVFLGADQEYCGLRDIDFSSPPFTPTKFDSLAPLSYNWNISPSTGWTYINSTDSTSEFPEIRFTQLGAYTITHKVTNTCGEDSDTVVVSFFEIPTIDSIPDTLLCFASDFSYVATASGGLAPYQYQWSSTPAGISHIGDSLYVSSLNQSYTVQVIVTDAKGCQDTTEFDLHARPQLFSNAGPDQALCYTDTTSLVGSASGGAPPYTFRWLPSIKLQNDTTPTTIRYPHDSTVTYVLEVTDSLGCTAYDSVEILVFPVIDLDAGPNISVCYDSLIHLLNFSSHAGGTWSGTGIIGSTFHPNIAGPGNHMIYYEYVDPNGCYYIDSLIAYVIFAPITDFSLSVNAGCSELDVQAFDSSTVGVLHYWYLNDSLVSQVANPQFRFKNLSHTKDTLIRVKLTVMAGTGCRDSLTRTATVYPRPLAQFSLPASICANDSVSAVQSSLYKTSATYRWSASSPSVNISDTTAAAPVFTFVDNQSGFDSTYTIQLIIASVDGCLDTTTQNITVYSRPTAIFTMPAAACSPVAISPIDSSLGDSLIYTWSVSPSVAISGNGGANPSFSFPVSFNDSVVYKISLLLTNDNGCIDSLSTNYTVYPRPTAAFTPSVNDSCGPMVVNFSNQSTSNLPGQTLADLTFDWDFGNGLFSTDSVPTSVFVNNGVVDTTYYVTLIVSNQFGCTDTIMDTITVHPDPRAELSTSIVSNCAPFVIDSSVVTASHYPAANQQYYWQILNLGGTVLAQDTGLYNLSHVITASGDSIILRIIAESLFGCTSDTSTQLMYTIPNPTADFRPAIDSACSPMVLNLIDSSSAGTNRHWYVNGVFHSSGPAPVFTFINNSTINDSLITIKAIVEAGTGCKDSVEHTVVVFPKPIADFSAVANSCPWDTVFTTNLSNGKIGATYSWSTSSATAWISNPTAANPQIVFANNQSGIDSTFYITLIVTSTDGCSDTIVKPITLYSRPVASFSLPAVACAPLTLVPTNNSTGSNLGYYWSTSSAATISNPNSATPGISYPVSTNDSVVYTITLVVTDTVNGCLDSMTQNYTVYPKPQAAFSVSTKDSCGPFTLNFANLSTTNQTGMDRSSMTFFWDFHNGQTSTDSVPTVTFINYGFRDTTYVITLIATNAFGCTDTVIDSITVHPDPKASITLISQADCAPWLIDSTVVNNIHYPGANASYTWELLDPNTRAVIATYSHSDSINYLLGAPGDSVIIRLTAVSIHLCKSDTVESLMYTIGKAFPGFMASTYAGCNPLTITFTDTVPGFTAWDWYANGKLFSNVQHPIHTFTNSSVTQDSIYEIKMIPVSGFGCQDSVVQNITVYAQIDMDWTAANSCITDSVVFVNNTQSIHAITTWAWDFGDGTTSSSQNPSHLFPAPGKYTVTLTATNIHGCSNTLADTITIYPRPIANFNISSVCGVDTLCKDQAVTLTDGSSIFSLGGNITQWAWDIDADGTVEYTTQNPSHTFTTPGMHDVRLIITSQYGCTDTVQKSYFINEIPQPFFTLDSVSECGPFNTSATDGSTGLIDSYLWQVYVLDSANNKILLYSTNQQNPNPLPTFLPNYGADTSYFISQTVSNCCGSATYIDTLTLKSMPVPVVLPSVTIGCNPLTVTFQLDGLTKGQPDYMIFDYGDGVVDTIYKFFQITPNNDTIWIWGQQHHTFTNTIVHDTIFNVLVTAVNNCGDSTISIPITVHPNNIQAFIGATPASGCGPLTVTVTDKSFGGTSTSWCLDFDTATGICNQPTAIGDSFLYTYNTPGTYVIAQFVVDACSADTAYKTITVYPSPTADFSHSGATCEDNLVNFLNLSTSNTNAIIGYHWDFGDGTSTFLTSPSHYFLNPGTYSVKLTVTTTSGCQDSIRKSITIYGKPDIDFGVTNACFNNQPVSFTDSSTTVNGQIVGTIWKFGDGNTSVASNPQHTYAAPGIYTVTLIHSTSFGCTDSSTRMVNIFPISKADFITTNALGKKCGAPQQISFINQSTSAAGYYWDLDYNGNRGSITSTLVNPSHIYMQDGAYDVLLVAYNANGCIDSIIKPVYIKPFPKAGFEGDILEGCAPLTVYFTDSSIYNFNGPGSIIRYDWDFGDGNTFSGSPNVTHTYAVPGQYTVTLVVESDGGCIDTLTIGNYVNVYTTPIASFSSAEVNSKSFNFINTSQYLDANTHYYWTFGDGKHSYEKNPKHTYNVDLFENDYLFEVCLYVSNDFGCADTICEELNLKGYLLFAPNAFAPDLEGAGLANYFLPSGHSMKEYHLRIFDEWGNVIFESTSLDENGIPNEPWDGKHAKKGTDLPMGAYVWKIDAIFNDGTKWGEKDNNSKLPYGTVTLIR